MSDIFVSFLERATELGPYGFIMILAGIALFIGQCFRFVAFLIFEAIERPRYHLAKERFWRAVRDGNPPEHPPRRNRFDRLPDTDLRDLIACGAVRRQVEACGRIFEEQRKKASR